MFFLCGCASRNVDTGNKPNIFLIIIDSLRPDHLGCYGYLRKTSPFIDKISEKSVLFENVITQSTWTKTSIPSLLASIYPDEHGVRGVEDALSEDVLLLPEILKEQGYSTCCVTANPWTHAKFGFNQGYDRFHLEYAKSEKLNAAILDWLRGHKGGPYFLYAHYMDIHWPFTPPWDYDIFGNMLGDKYDGEILYLDTRVRKFFAQLKRTGALSNTWIVITADHGEEFFDHGGRSHARTLYREVLKVPLIFYNPDMIEKQKMVKRQVRLIDVAPTILDLAGIAIPETMKGVSLKDDIMKPGFSSEEDLEAISQVGLNDVTPNKDLIAISGEDYKYIYDFISKKEALYDLRSDPYEKSDISLENPGIVEKFREKVDYYRKNQKPLPVSKVKEQEMDKELKKQLKSLGYLQ